jgi:tetratricopeptide (TPR) repeat protein
MTLGAALRSEGKLRWFAGRAPVLVWMIAMAGQAATFDELAGSATAARRSNNIPEAIELYRQALSLKAGWEEGWWFVGTLSYSLYRYADCEDAFTRFVELDQTRVLGWDFLGLCEFETRHYDGALTNLERGMSMGSEVPAEVDAGVRFHYGLLMTRAGFFERGRRQLARFARTGGGEPTVISGLGVNALRERMLPQDIPPERQDMFTRAGKATCAWILGDRSKADAEFLSLVKDYPRVRGVHFLYGTFLSESRADEAKVEFRRELEVNPHSAEAHAMLALLLAPEDVSGALAQAREAASEQPADPMVEYAYGKALIASGGVETGITQLESAERSDPEALEYHLALASAYAKAGRNRDARRERLKSMSMAKGQDGSD